MDFLPISKKDLIKLGLSEPDFICITGDAYVDHPTFGVAIISRILEYLGFTVGIISQPITDKDYMELGKPRYSFMITGGNIDSMVANYTVAGKKRFDDSYSPGGKGGKRPDRAVTVYSNKVKELYPDIPVVIGGLEASLRRFAHYDFWENKVMPSVLLTSRADLLIYGMGEVTLTDLSNRLRAGEKISEIRDLRGTCYLTEPINSPIGAVQCDSFEVCSENKKSYAKSCRKQYDEQDEIHGRILIQRHKDKMLVQNPPQRGLTPEEFDKTYELPFMRTYHPIYEKMGGVPAISEVEFSITHNRGCFGFCNFCSIALHQGRKIQTRSEESILREGEFLSKQSNFKGYIHDVGGPTANFRLPSCKKQLTMGLCKGKKCHSCENLEVSHTEYLSILRKLRSLPNIKKVFIRSGIRYDYLIKDKDSDFLKELTRYHISGRLKVAPEHSSQRVLGYMGKPAIENYIEFQKRFYEETKRCNKEQYLVPYLMSSHPGSTLKDAVELAVFLKENNLRPEQVQDFYPTPGTISTAMYYTGMDPYTLKEVYLPDAEERNMQRALLQYYKKENADIVRKALLRVGRQDLIGDGKNCLVKGGKKNNEPKKKNTGKTFKKKKH